MIDSPEAPSPGRLPLPDAEFRRALLACLPHLRAFARGLCGKTEQADDLVQETALRAWAARARFQPDSNLRAWLFTILRNHFLNERRRHQREAAYDEGLAERTLVELPAQEGRIHLTDVERALQALPPEQREALLLVGASGFTYEQAAAICETAPGTIKSRVSRGRAALLAAQDG